MTSAPVFSSARNTASTVGSGAVVCPAAVAQQARTEQAKMSRALARRLGITRGAYPDNTFRQFETQGRGRHDRGQRFHRRQSVNVAVHENGRCLPARRVVGQLELAAGLAREPDEELLHRAVLDLEVWRQG